MRTRPVVTALAGIGVALAVLGGVTACSSSSDGADSASTSASATPTSPADAMTAMCEQLIADAMTVEAAEALAESSGYVTRIGTLDGEPQAVTTDFREDRFTFDVTDGIVVGCTLG
ncbi:MAG: hypothetical protein Q7V58_14010 [Actinomycetota bacterium]|nr:hypothetical protein [Actinomycetota bacterium]